MPLPTAKAIEIVAFVPAESIDPVRIGASYYLAADGAVAAKPYTLLRRALERSSKVAVAKFAMAQPGAARTAAGPGQGDGPALDEVARRDPGPASARPEGVELRGRDRPAVALMDR